MQQIFDLRIIIIILYFFIGLSSISIAQPLKTDSLTTASKDSAQIRKIENLKKLNNSLKTIFQNNPYFNFKEKAAPPPYSIKKATPGREFYFYSLVILFLFFAILKTVFSKYFSDQLSFFFRRGLKYKQLKSQLIQSPLPSVLFNLFFFLTGGFYIFLAIKYHNSSLDLSIWQLIIFCPLALLLIYSGKFLILKFLGWVFQFGKLTDNYIFTIFSINKIMGIFLLPFLVLIALSNNQISTIGWTLSIVFICCMFLYRFISAIGLIRNENNISALHFLLYIIAFEVLPTIILYKAIVNFLK